MAEPRWPDGFLELAEQFLADDHLRLPWLDIYPEVFATPLFFPLQRQRELAAMMRIARSISPVTVMEIGADKGGGLYHWCKCLPTVRRVIACEIGGLPYAHLFERTFPYLKFHWFEGSSYSPEIVAGVKLRLGQSGRGIDCLFIDGDKLAFLRDFDAYLSLMSPGGIVFMHDVQDREPGRAFDQAASRGYRTELILDTTDSREAMAREEAGIPSTGPHEAWLRHWRGASCSVGVIYLGERL